MARYLRKSVRQGVPEKTSAVVLPVSIITVHKMHVFAMRKNIGQVLLAIANVKQDTNRMVTNVKPYVRADGLNKITDAVMPLKSM